MNLLETNGFQMMLGNLLKAAAPDLVDRVDQFVALAQNVDARMARIEAMLIEMRNGNGRSNEHPAGVATIVRPHNGTGK